MVRCSRGLSTSFFMALYNKRFMIFKLRRSRKLSDAQLPFIVKHENREEVDMGLMCAASEGKRC